MSLMANHRLYWKHLISHPKLFICCHRNRGIKVWHHPTRPKHLLSIQPYRRQMEHLLQPTEFTSTSSSQPGNHTNLSECVRAAKQTVTPIEERRSPFSLMGRMFVWRLFICGRLTINPSVVTHEARLPF